MSTGNNWAKYVLDARNDQPNLDCPELNQFKKLFFEDPLKARALLQEIINGSDGELFAKVWLGALSDRELKLALRDSWFKEPEFGELIREAIFRER